MSFHGGIFMRLLRSRRILDLFTQEAAYPFTIRTVDATTGSPVPESSVTMIGPATYSGVTDSTGTYTVPSLIPGKYDIHITKSGYNNYDVYGINCGGPGAGYTAGLIPVGFTPPKPGEPLYIPTTLTITGPANFVPYLPFDISGKLIPEVQPANLPITNFNIELSFNGTKIGTAKTDPDGNYSYKVTIEKRGVFTITANFAGSGYYLPSSAQLKVSSGLPAGPLRNLLHNLFPGTFPLV